jgi:hypothetical protein
MESSGSSHNKQQITMAENSNNQACTFKDAFVGVLVDPNICNARSRFEEHPEGLEEEARRLHLDQEEIDEDFNQGQMYEETMTQNLPSNPLLPNEIDLNRGDMSGAGRQLYQERLAAMLDGTTTTTTTTPTAGTSTATTGEATTTTTPIAGSTAPSTTHGQGEGQGNGGHGGRGHGQGGQGGGG